MTARGFSRIAVAAAVATLMTIVPPAHAQTPDVSEFKLKNGLQVVVITDRRAPVVTHMIYYKVGSADELPGKSGVAHFLEHMMFKGTEKNPAGRFSKMLSTIGGKENAFVTTDYTGYFQRVPRRYLRDVMAFEADRMTGLKFSDAHVRAERDVVIEEYNTRVANSPTARLGQQIAAALYLNHPYGRPVIGWRDEIERLNREDALDFYRRFYDPRNAVVVVAGDVGADEVKVLAEETYGAIPQRAGIETRRRPQEPKPVAMRRVTMDDANVAQPSVHRGYLVPSYATAEQGEAEALDVLGHVLGAGANSRLYRRLVMEKQLATIAGAAYRGSALDATRFSIYAVPRPDIALSAVEDEIDNAIAAIIADGVTAAELERAKTRLIADAIYAQDNQATMARWFGAALSTGSTVRDVLAWPERVKAVTAAEVQAAARTWLDRRRSVTGYLVKSLPAKEEKRS